VVTELYNMYEKEMNVRVHEVDNGTVVSLLPGISILQIFSNIRLFLVRHGTTEHASLRPLMIITSAYM